MVLRKRQIYKTLRRSGGLLKKIVLFRDKFKNSGHAFVRSRGGVFSEWFRGDFRK